MKKERGRGEWASWLTLWFLEASCQARTCLLLLLFLVEFFSGGDLSASQGDGPAFPDVVGGVPCHLVVSPAPGKDGCLMSHLGIVTPLVGGVEL